jgi:hypothetical protein
LSATSRVSSADAPAEPTGEAAEVLSFSSSRARSWLPTSGLAPDSYLTDGVRLFRLVSPFDPAANPPFAMLEDCTTLVTSPYLPHELSAMHLRLVRAGDRG